MGKNLSVPMVRLDPEFTVLVTGGNTGLGYETAKHLGLMGARVIIACRNEQRAKCQNIFVCGYRGCSMSNSKLLLAIQKMHEEYETIHSKIIKEAVKPNVEFMALDLGSMESTVHFIEAYKAKGYPLNVMVCNAGIAFIPKEMTADGYEKQFQVNYLGHSLILLHLLPVMRRSGPDCRIIYISSLGHTFGEVNLDNIQGQRYYRKNLFYGNSKMFQVMQMYTLGRRLKGSNISLYAVHPGIVRTEISRGYDNDWLWGTWWKLCKVAGVMRTSYEGATTIINCAVNPELAGQEPGYYENCKPSKSSKLSRDKLKQEVIWKYTLECLHDFVTEDLVKDLRDPVGL